MLINAITTCNAEGWEKYGRSMASSFVNNWDSSMNLTVYAEGFTPDVNGVAIERLPSWFETWKTRHADHADAHGLDPSRNRFTKRAYDYRRDCVRFAHKIAAVTDAGERQHNGLMIWMDSDTVTHAPVSRDWVAGLVVKYPSYLHWLTRRGTYPECGFVLFRPVFPAHVPFMARMRDIYESDEVFALRETHDSYVFQHVAREFVRMGLIPEPLDLCGPESQSGHPFTGSRLAEKLDHLKGARKIAGRTPAHEAPGRKEAYWQ